MKNKYFIACAGSGKTTHIIKETLQSTEQILITTYTDNNCEEIKQKYYEIIGYIPSNVEILPWFTFELRHLIRPFQLSFIDTDIKNVYFLPDSSKTHTNQESKKYYLNKDNLIYSDKIALLAYKTMLNKKEEVINRFKSIFSKIYIDEVQDLVGYDLEIIRLLMENDFTVTLVGDPRQKTYSTHYARKNMAYKNDAEKYILKYCSDYCIIDKSTLNYSYRCPEKIISYASTLFPQYPISHSNAKSLDDDGIYIVKSKDISKFINSEYKTMQLRFSATTTIDNLSRVITFGKSKGSTYENALIYPTSAFKKAIKFNDFKYIKSELTLCKYYVALTRAKHKVGIVFSDRDLNNLNNPNVQIWEPKI